MKNERLNELALKADFHKANNSPLFMIVHKDIEPNINVKSVN